MNWPRRSRHNRIIAGYLTPHFLQRRLGGCRAHRGVDPLDVAHERIPVTSGDQPERVTDQVPDAGWPVVSGQTLPTTSAAP